MDKEKKRELVKGIIPDIGRPAEVARRLNDKDMRKRHKAPHQILASYVSTWMWNGKIPKKYHSCLEELGISAERLAGVE